MTDIYRRELKQFGIKVIAIEPGPIRTEIWKKNLNKMDEFKDTSYFKFLYLIYYKSFSPFLNSFFKSSISSNPTETLKKPSVIPIFFL